MGRPIKRTFPRDAILHTRISTQHKELLNRMLEKKRKSSILYSEADLVEAGLELLSKSMLMAPWWNPE